MSDESNQQPPAPSGDQPRDVLVVVSKLKAYIKTKSGKPIGRPAITPERRAAIRAAYTAGSIGMRDVAKTFGVGVETVRRCLLGG